MKKILYLMSVFISIGKTNSMEPMIVFPDRKPIKLCEVHREDLKEMSLDTLAHLREDLEWLTGVLSPIILELENNEITANDAYFAINGAKMDLKEALTEKQPTSSKLVEKALSTLDSIEQKYSNTLGYDYCLAILLRHFPENLTNAHYEKFFQQIPEDKKRRGLELMKKAAEEGDDEDAVFYLQYNKE